jgi:deoxycytidylate deaminase
MAEPDRTVVRAAIDASRHSPCQSKRGVAIFHPTTTSYAPTFRVTGFNHKPVGFECNGSDGCKATCGDEAIHAEEAALLAAGPLARFADLLHVKTVDGQIVPSGVPSCLKCSRLILGAGLLGVWLYHETGWRRYAASEFHRLTLDLHAYGRALLTEYQRLSAQNEER